jgi:hypothetical protein
LFWYFQIIWYPAARFDTYITCLKSSFAATAALHRFTFGKNYFTKKLFTMKKIILLLAVVASTFTTFSQNKPLKGSGKTVEKTFALSGFDKIDLLDLDGVMEVEAGKEFSVTAVIDDNLAPLLEANVDNGCLTIQLKGNLYNKLYVEETNIKIKISLPMVSFIKHRSNGKLTVNGITGKYFGIKNTGNGNAYINGSVDELDIVCRDNGSVYATGTKAKKVKAERSGNGNIYRE